MTPRNTVPPPGHRTFAVLTLVLLFLPGILMPRGVRGQSRLPGDRIHVSLAFGGYFMLGVGYTHWVEQHHALEFTLFPLIQPGEGLPLAIRAGHAWIPSDEVWRAKLGGNVTLLVETGREGWKKFTPILAFTPGLQYEPDSDRSFRTDLWMSYFPTQRVFAPSTIEVLAGFKD